MRARACVCPLFCLWFFVFFDCRLTCDIRHDTTGTPCQARHGRHDTTGQARHGTTRQARHVTTRQACGVMRSSHDTRLKRHDTRTTRTARPPNWWQPTMGAMSLCRSRLGGTHAVPCPARPPEGLRRFDGRRSTVEATKAYRGPGRAGHCVRAAQPAPAESHATHGGLSPCSSLAVGQ